MKNQNELLTEVLTRVKRIESRVVQLMLKEGVEPIGIKDTTTTCTKQKSLRTESEPANV